MTWEDPNWIFCAVWDKEDRMEGLQGVRYSGWSAIITEEV